ncbi:MAG: hypothetical protein ACTSVU_02465 [Promethearchaeota archaeon]
MIGSEIGLVSIRCQQSETIQVQDSSSFIGIQDGPQIPITIQITTPLELIQDQYQTIKIDFNFQVTQNSIINYHSIAFTRFRLDFNHLNGISSDHSESKTLPRGQVFFNCSESSTFHYNDSIITNLLIGKDYKQLFLRVSLDIEYNYINSTYNATQILTSFESGRFSSHWMGPIPFKGGELEGEIISESYYIDPRDIIVLILIVGLLGGVFTIIYRNIRKTRLSKKPNRFPSKSRRFNKRRK